MLVASTHAWPAPPLQDPLVGTWVGARPKSSFSRVVISHANHGYEAHIWAFSTFEEIDWGKQPIHPYFSDVSGTRLSCATGRWNDDDTGDTLVIFRPHGKAMTIETLNHVNDNSGRSDFDSIETLRRKWDQVRPPHQPLALKS